MRKRVLVIALIVVVVLALLLWVSCRGKRPGHVKDEAATVGRTAESLPAADEDYFKDMDYGVSQRPEEVRAVLDPYVKGISAQDAVSHFVKGRNNWVVWTGGNDRLWDELNRVSFGTLDLLKTISSHPKMSYGRRNRWEYLGLVNEPCFAEPKAARTDRYGLWLDVRKPGCGDDPFENKAKYPGVKIGARGKNIDEGSFYGYATGVVGLRLFPNPAFDENAQKKWNPERYYTDPTYYNDKDLIKPYRVGMSCGFCHISHNPSNPPANPEEPEWANLNNNPGAQYFWVDRIFVWNPNEKNFFYQLFHGSRPGGLDTSFVSSDQINNPRAMNAVYNLPARLAIAQKFGDEEIAGDELLNKQFNDYDWIPKDSPLRGFYDANTKRVKTPHVLKDGADSVGSLGALNRVYINIGLFSEEWMLHFIPLLGGASIKPISPIRIADAEKNSSYWKATEMQTPDVALFFLAASRPDKLAAAPGGAAWLSTDQNVLNRGKVVFAERCARCHSSVLPERAYTYFKPGCIGPDYMKCWDAYWQYTKSADFKQQMTQLVMDPHFLDPDKNALTTDVRVPVTLLETNCCSPLATNAIKGDIWDNFASKSYKSLPSLGSAPVQNPVTGKNWNFPLEGGGRGFTRPPSLVSIWATAPFLVNNNLGPFMWRGDVKARMDSFNVSIDQLLWPEHREGEDVVTTKSGLQHPGHTDRLKQKAYVMTDVGYLPGFAKPLPRLLAYALPNVFTIEPKYATPGWAYKPDAFGKPSTAPASTGSYGYGSSGSGGGEMVARVKLGPFPKGTPVSLISNVNLMSNFCDLFGFVVGFQRYLEAVNPNDSDEVTAKKFAPLVPKLLKLSKCPDYIGNKGHYFGTQYLPASEGEPGLSDADKRALIEYMKTF